ncbi:Alpha/Beta hydrolase protein [Suillus ampliporus]|nr:Alpha/Beta hydrolase protein [Suillus ampliporus]
MANIKIQTTDNHTLGAWFILSDTIYHELPFPPPPHATDLHISEAMLHNARLCSFSMATWALSTHIRLYSAFTARLNTNVLAIDYRGFGDSPGNTYRGRAAWDWLIAQGALPQDVLIVGHSLGTAVASRLSVSLSKDGVKFRGTVLMSPFSSLYTLLDTYHIFGLFPVMLPINMIPRAASKCFLIHEFDTLSVISKVKVPLLILHAEDGWDISHTHSDALFDALLEPYLPPVYSLPASQESWSKQQWNEYHTQLVTWRETHKSLLARTVIPNFGLMDQFEGFGERIVLLKTFTGSHNEIGTLEGVQDVICATFFRPETLH